MPEEVGFFTYMRNNSLSCAAFLFSAIGSWFVADVQLDAQMFGFQIWIVSNILWIVYGVKKSDWFVVATFAIYFVFNLRGVANRCGWCAI